jgi:hypothetical protein
MPRKYQPICSHPGCSLPHSCKGYCSPHYNRWRKGKAMDAPIRPAHQTDEQRFWSKVDKSGPCWLWMGCTTNGYGIFRFRSRNTVAHRVSYEWATGPIPEGYEVDHTCFNHSCVRPDHLRILTHAENGQNRASANKNSKSGVRGVYQIPSGVWIARASIGPDIFEIGRFSNMRDAEIASIKWRREHMPASLNDRRKVA